MKKFILILAVALPFNHISAENNLFNTISGWIKPALGFVTFTSLLYLISDDSDEVTDLNTLNSQVKKLKKQSRIQRQKLEKYKTDLKELKASHTEQKCELEDTNAMLQLYHVSNNFKIRDLEAATLKQNSRINAFESQSWKTQKKVTNLNNRINRSTLNLQNQISNSSFTLNKMAQNQILVSEFISLKRTNSKLQKRIDSLEQSQIDGMNRIIDEYESFVKDNNKQMFAFKKSVTDTISKHYDNTFNAIDLELLDHKLDKFFTIMGKK